MKKRLAKVVIAGTLLGTAGVAPLMMSVHPAFAANPWQNQGDICTKLNGNYGTWYINSTTGELVCKGNWKGPIPA